MKSLLQIVSLTAIAASANAATLSLNFVDYTNGNTAYTGAGVLDTDSRTWSAFTGSGNSATGAVTAATGTYGGITVTANDYGNFRSNTSPSINLFDGYMFSGTSNNGAESMTISGLAAGKYDLAVFAAWGWGAQGNSFSITDANGTTANKTTTGASTSAFAEGVNYVVFEDLTVDGSGTLILNFDGGNTGTTQWLVSGLELVSVPEPSSAMFLGLAGLGLMIRRRA